MLRHTLKIILTLSIAVASAFNAASFTVQKDRIKKKSNDSGQLGVIELRSAFRNSSAVVEGRCIESYLSPTGTYFSNYKVEKLLAGNNISDDSVITVLGKDSKGESRILYLGKSINDVHSENEAVYNIASGGRLPFDGENVVVSNRIRVPIELIENDIVALKNETAVPLKYYYYNDADKLVKNSSSIFVGRLENIERVENAELYKNNRGEVIMQSGAYSEFSVKIMNGFLSPHNFGDTVTVRTVDGCEKFLIDARTNGHFSADEQAYDPMVGSVYIFFVKNSPDEKADHYFLINQYQGMIETVDESINVHHANEAFWNIENYNDLLIEIAKVYGMPISYLKNGNLNTKRNS